MRRALSLLIVGLAGFSFGQIRRAEISPTSDQTEILVALIPAPEPMNAREVGAWQMICSGILEGNDVFVRENIFVRWSGGDRAQGDVVE